MAQFSVGDNNGFGIVFPEIDGEPGFDEVERSLDLIASLPVRVVVPGHGIVFRDVDAALAEARSRLAFFRRHPERHAHHAAKALLMFHMLEVGEISRTQLQAWLEGTPIHVSIWRRYFSEMALHAWTKALLQDLQKAGALQFEGETVRCS